MYLLRRTLGLVQPTPEPIIVTPLQPETTSNLPQTTPPLLTPPTTTDPELKPPEQQPVAGSVGATLWSILSSKLGGDVLTAGISLPSWLYEPLSILQRQAEMIEYGQVLNFASECSDPVERLAYIAGFAVSGYSATQRYKPDFNPLLGETFSYVDSRNNTKFFAEQVSHHPPLSSFHAFNDDNWVLWQNSCPVTKFLGNCIDLDTQGNTHVLFPKTGDHYFYTNPQCTRIHNVIFGSMWIEHFGVLHIRNVDGSLSCTINFKKSGFFQGTQYKVEGFIEDNDGNKLVKLEGRWDASLEGKWLTSTSSVSQGETRKLWAIARDTFLHDEYNFTQFTASLNDFDQEMEVTLLPTDSRRRLDRRFLEKGDTTSATHWKKIIEERQRQDRRVRNEEWKPVWFQLEPFDILGEDKSMWVYKGNYWEDRDVLVKQYLEGKEVMGPKPPQVIGLACDFTSYVPGVFLPLPPSENDTTNDTDTTTDPSDPTTRTGTDEGHEEDTDTDTDLEEVYWNDNTNTNNNNTNTSPCESGNSTETTETETETEGKVDGEDV